MPHKLLFATASSVGLCLWPIDGFSEASSGKHASHRGQIKFPKLSFKIFVLRRLSNTSELAPFLKDLFLLNFNAPVHATLWGSSLDWFSKIQDFLPFTFLWRIPERFCTVYACDCTDISGDQRYFPQWSWKWYRKCTARCHLFTKRTLDSLVYASGRLSSVVRSRG